MISNWHFNKNTLNEYINNGLVLLKDQTLSHTTRECIEKEINDFKRFLTNDFENSSTIESAHHDSLSSALNHVLKKMKKHYELLGKDLIDWLILLNNEYIFDSNTCINKTNLSIEKQAKLTIKNYEKNSKTFLRSAKNFLTNPQNYQIQKVIGSKCSSYCYYSQIANKPFFIINPTEDPFVLNHEIQHGIEFILKYNTHTCFTELGSIYFELLFLDTLAQEQGFILNGDYQSKINDASYQIKSICEYFNIMLECAKKDFVMTDKELSSIIIKHIDIMPKYLIQYLNREFLSIEIDLDIIYLLSYIKAIELRDITKRKNFDSIDILEPYLKPNKFNFNIPDDYFSIYERFIEDMEQKTKVNKK